MTIKFNYEKACYDYVVAFCEKHNFDYTPGYIWVAGEAGTVACVSDYFFDMQTIIHDLELNAPEDELLKWYDYCMEMRDLGSKSIPNFKSWVCGCPRKSRREIERLLNMKREIDKLKHELLAMANVNDASET